MQPERQQLPPELPLVAELILSTPSREVVRDFAQLKSYLWFEVIIPAQASDNPMISQVFENGTIEIIPDSRQIILRHQQQIVMIADLEDSIHVTGAGLSNVIDNSDNLLELLFCGHSEIGSETLAAVADKFIDDQDNHGSLSPSWHSSWADTSDEAGWSFEPVTEPQPCLHSEDALVRWMLDYNAGGYPVLIREEYHSSPFPTNDIGNTDDRDEWVIPNQLYNRLLAIMETGLPSEI